MKPAPHTAGRRSLRTIDIAYSFELIEQAEKLLAVSREMLSTTKVLLSARNDWGIPQEWEEKPILSIASPLGSAKQVHILDSDRDLLDTLRAA